MVVLDWESKEFKSVWADAFADLKLDSSQNDISCAHFKMCYKNRLDSICDMGQENSTSQGQG